MLGLFMAIFAATYGSAPYSTSTYGGVTTHTTTGTAAGGSLSNTGIAVVSFVTVACVVLLVAILVRVWRRPSKKASTDPEV